MDTTKKATTKKKSKPTAPVQVDEAGKHRVERFLIGKKITLSKFYSEAAEEKLKKETK